MAAALLLAGCAEDKPREPKASAAPTVTVPTMPAAAEKNSEAGAIAFVKHYIDVFNYASNTGDVKELQKLSDPKCEGCTSYIELYAGTYAAGGFYKGGDWNVSNVITESQNGLLIVFAHVSAQAPQYRLNSDSGVKTGTPEDTDLSFVPKHASNGWSIQEFGRQRGDAQ